MKLKSLCRLVRHDLFCNLHSIRIRARILLGRAAEKVALGCLGYCASADDLQGIASHDLRPSTGIGYRVECTSRKNTHPTLSVDTRQAENQTCNRPETFSVAARVMASEAGGQSTKCRRQVPWLSRLTLLGVCVYGPVLPMWYLSTTSIAAPTCLLLATQAWISGGLCLLASSWIDDLNSLQNVKVHTPLPTASSETEVKP